MTISRVTIFSLLLALMLGLGIYMRAQGERDACNSYPADGVPPAREYVVSGTRQIAVPCSDWWMRQPLTVQVFCMADAALAILFLLNALTDLRDWLAMRRRLRIR